MATNDGLVFQFQVVINQQDTPAISLEGLKELRRLCDCMILLGEENENTKTKLRGSAPIPDAVG